MAKYNFVNISYSQKDNVLVLNENVEEIINEQAMYGFKLSHIINLEIGIDGYLFYDRLNPISLVHIP